MNPRHILSAIWVVGLLVVGCGRATAEPDDPVGVSPPADVISFPDEGDAAVVRIGRVDELPRLVIGGDGWAYFPLDESPAEVAPSGFAGSGQAYRSVPAPPVATPVGRRQLTDEGFDIVLELADELDLLEEPGEYDAPSITDVGSTTVSFTVERGMFEHDAYALGYQSESGNRKRLLRFVDELADLEGLVGSNNIGPVESYAPERYVVTDRGGFYLDEGDLDGSRQWPTDLAVMEGCVALPLDRFPAGAAGIWVADSDDGPVRVGVVPDLPGDACN